MNTFASFQAAVDSMIKNHCHKQKVDYPYLSNGDIKNNALAMTVITHSKVTLKWEMKCKKM